MAASIFQPAGALSNAEALRLSQQAPVLLQSSPASFSASPLKALFSAKETPDLWAKYENLLVSCLRTSDDESASQCLQRIANRFGENDERVMALRGLVKEAQAEDSRALDDILKEYDAILQENDTNIPIAKRRVALLRSMGRVADAVTALNNLLEFSPTDPEAWSELADIYLSQGLYSQAIFSLEEVLVLAPNAWNMHARLGEVLYMAATTATSTESPVAKLMAESIKRFCRSIELCDDYLRGHYGLKLATSYLLGSQIKEGKPVEPDEPSLPDRASIERLDEMATAKLGEIVLRSSQKIDWQAYDEAEVTAARELLSKESATVR